MYLYGVHIHMHMEVLIKYAALGSAYLLKLEGESPSKA